MSSLTFYGWATTSTCRVIVSVFRRNRNDTVKLTKPRAKRMADTKARARRLRTMIYIYFTYYTTIGIRRSLLYGWCPILVLT